MENLHTIIVTGTPYEQGVQQGKQLTSVILENIKNVKKTLADAHTDTKKYIAAMQKNASFLEKNHPSILEEMHGIADGSQISFSDILLINIPTYFMRQAFSAECSMILARNNATADGKTYLIKNRDMKMVIHQAVIEHHYNDGLNISEVNGAGIVTYPANGINSHGLAIATTGFWSSKTYSEPEDVESRHIFVNIHILLEQCATASDVVEALKTYPRMNGLNIIAADKSGAVLIETTRDGQYEQWDDGSGIMFRTNHYLLADHQKLNPSFDEYTSTFKRYERIETMLRQCPTKLRFQDLIRIMSDHTDGEVNSICRHANPAAPATTVSCSIAIVEDGEMFSTPGNPCMHLIYSKI